MTFIQQALAKYGLEDLPTVNTPGNANIRLCKAKALDDNTCRPEERTKAHDEKFVKRYQGMVGTLNWIAMILRPDIAHDTALAARYNANPTL